jgi:dGTPase
MVCDIIRNSWQCTGLGGDNKNAHPSIKMSPRVLKATDIMRDYLFENVYNVQSALPETERARATIRFLYKYYLKHYDELAPEYLLHSDYEWRGVIDKIASMTDQYALKTARDLRKKKG